MTKPNEKIQQEQKFLQLPKSDKPDKKSQKLVGDLNFEGLTDTEKFIKMTEIACDTIESMFSGVEE